MKKTVSKPSRPARIFILTCIILATTCTSVVAEQPSMKELRKQAAERQRRIIFNNDGHDLVAHTRKPTAEGILAKRTAELAGTQVDAIFYCTLSAGFGNFTHFTKVGQMHMLREAPLQNNPLPDLYKAGIDPLHVMIDFAHGNKMECFWSMRMNDTHDAGTRDHRPVLFNSNKLKQEHPEYLLGEKGEKMACGGWSGVNYARPEIRELAFRFVEEVCQNYNIDGIELDFYRHPVFFKTTANGNPVTQQELNQMTDLMRRIRAMTDKIGHERGRPILVAMRLPDSVEYSKIIGLDMENWMAEDLLDIYIASSYMQLNDWTYSVALARKYGIKIYPSLDESRIANPEGAKRRMSVESFRGRAANVWESGADGVYLFNMFNPKLSIWRELGEPSVLAKLDKDYFASIRGVARAAGGNYPHQKFLRLETLNPADPRTVKRGATASATIRTGENGPDIAGDATITLRLQFKAIAENTPLTVAINGEKLPAAKAQNNWLEFALRHELVRKGANRVEVTLDKKSKRQLDWTDLMITVRQPQSK